jgi:dTDP-4-amino-4,6-dideoxygalactose transaminase
VKTRVDDLALFGGQPEFDVPLHVGRPNLGSRERLKTRLDDILDRVWLTNDGPCVQEFEGRLREMLDVEHCVATCNATAALELLLEARGLSGEVILPSFTFVATAHAVRRRGLVPVFADVHPTTLTLDPERVEELVSPRTSAILGVHLWGRACDVNGLAPVAQRHDLTLLFDAAQALGCSYHGQAVGGFGSAEVFSFHATKICNSFEGGAVATNDVELAERLRLMRNFGFSGTDEVASLGTNAKMTEVAAAMGITSLESLSTFVERNRVNHESYREGLEGVTGFGLRPYPPGERTNHHYVVGLLESTEAGLGRDDLVEVLEAEGVLARRYFYPGCHRMEPYRSQAPGVAERLSVTERILERAVSLPTGMAVEEDAIRRVCQIIRLTIANGDAIRARLVEGRARFA